MESFIQQCIDDGTLKLHHKYTQGDSTDLSKYGNDGSDSKVEYSEDGVLLPVDLSKIIVDNATVLKRVTGSWVVHGNLVQTDEARLLSKRNDNPNLLVDGDMEKSGIVDWKILNDGTVTKETGTPYEGTRNVKIAYNGTSNPSIYQAGLLTDGEYYRVKCRIRTNGCDAFIKFGTTTVWQGSSATWLEVDEIAASSGGGNVWLWSVGCTQAGEYVEYDMVSVTPVEQLLADGNMEASGFDDWLISNNGTVTKETGDPYEGTRNAKIEYNGTNNPGIYQAGLLTDGEDYRVICRIRTNGCDALIKFGTTTVWQGNSATWLKVDEIATSGGTGNIWLHSALCNGSGDYVEYDLVSVTPVRQVLVDGDMEAVGVTDWTAGHGATLTKEVVNPYEGAQCLRITRVGDYGTASQDVLTVGKTYRITGYVRGDGTAYLTIACDGALWQSTSSTSWQKFDFAFTAGASIIYFYKYTSSDYVELDMVSITEQHGYEIYTTTGPDKVNFNTVSATGSLANKRYMGINATHDQTPKLFLDGEYESDFSDTVNLRENVGPLYLGCSDLEGENFTSDIKNILIFSRELTPLEHYRVYVELEYEIFVDPDPIEDLYDFRLEAKAKSEGFKNKIRFSAPPSILGSELLTDGDMEAEGVTAWTAGNSATLEKETTSPFEGLQNLKVARNGVNNPYASQSSILVAGKWYHATGRARSDGNAVPEVGSLTKFWTGTTSTDWQYFDIYFIADLDEFFLYVTTSTGTEYCEFDIVSVKEVTGVLHDGTMEAFTAGLWEAGNSATLSKQTGTPHGGLRCLRVAYNAVNDPYAQQENLFVPIAETYGFDDRFISAASVIANGGTIYGTPTIDNGVTLNGSTDYITYALDGTEFNTSNLSIIVEFYPDFAASADVEAALFCTGTTNEFTVYKRNNAGSNELGIVFNDTLIAFIAEATYSPYWNTGEKNVLVVSGISGDTSAWLNGNKILDSDNTAWTGYACTSMDVGRRTNGTRYFDGKITKLQICQSLLSEQEFKVEGWGRGDGTGYPTVDCGGTVWWTGTTSTDWQKFSFIVTTIVDNVQFYCNISATGYCEFDDISIAGYPWDGAFKLLWKQGEYPQSHDDSAARIIISDICNPYDIAEWWEQEEIGLVAGQIYYYAIFARNELGVWKHNSFSNRASAYPYDRWGSATYMFKSLPTGWRTADVETGGDLEDFMTIFGALFDNIKTDCEHLLTLFDANEVHADLLYLLDRKVGWPTWFAAGALQRRQETLAAVTLYKYGIGRKGAYESAIENISDWDAHLVEGWRYVFFSNGRFNSKTPDLSTQTKIDNIFAKRGQRDDLLKYTSANNSWHSVAGLGLFLEFIDGTSGPLTNAMMKRYVELVEDYLKVSYAIVEFFLEPDSS
jgi:hypothetical protein